MRLRHFATLLLLLSLIGCLPSNQTETVDLEYLKEAPPGIIPKVFAPGLVSVKGRFDLGVTISPDGTVIAYGAAHESDPGQNNIHFLVLEGSDWKVKEGMLPENENTFFPMFGPEPGQFYFSKAVEGKDNDIWLGEYEDGKVKNVRPLSDYINSVSREAGHGQSTDGSLYFTSNRDETYACCGDIYRSVKENGVYGPAEKVQQLNSTADEESLYLAPDGSYIIIQAWKSEYQSKHDLYISFKTKSGSWTSPQRLNEKINGPEIEQRPFVSPDGKYLFFSRMSIEETKEGPLYESDTYWVSTTEVFKPFVFNAINTFVVSAGADFQWQIPADMFRDLNDEELVYEATLADGSPLMEWLNFNPDTRTFTGNWTEGTSIALKIEAKDSQQQKAELVIELKAK